MSRPPTITVPPAVADDLLLLSYARSLRASDRAPDTIKLYLTALRLFGAFLAREGMPATPGGLAREHVEAWIVALKTEPSPRTGQPLARASVQARWLAIRQYFAWLVEQGEIHESPMRNLKAPKVTPPAVRVYTDAEMRRLLATCEKDNRHEGRLAYALLCLLADTGMRIGEAAGLAVTDLDLDEQEAAVLGKGNKRRRAHFGSKTTAALDRYLRARKRHAYAGLPDLWLGRNGALGRTSLYMIVKAQAAAAELPELHPHSLRHQAIHTLLDNGAQESDVMRQMGHSPNSRAVFARYGAAGADKRTKKAMRHFGPLDHLDAE